MEEQWNSEFFYIWVNEIFPDNSIYIQGVLRLLVQTSHTNRK